MTELTKAELHAVICKNRHAVVASRDPNGAPQAALVGIAVSPELEIYFDTTEFTRKAVNLRRDPRVALVIGWDNEQSVQLDGYADEPKGAELTALKAIYFAAFPDGPSRENWPGITWFRVRPRWIRFSDFNLTDGAVREITL